jgi:transcriptional regulator with XRE-family HTH domain
MEESKAIINKKITLKDHYISLRESAPKFIKDIAEACGVSERTVYNWINGEIIPNKLIQEKISTIIQIPIEDLFPNQETEKV